MSNALSFALAGALMNKERQQEFQAKYIAGLNLGFNAAEPAPLPPDAMPVTTPDAYSRFPIGSPVRDILSGIDGIVAAPPEGEFGDVVFITGNEDGKTYAVRFDQVKAIEQAPAMGAPMPPPLPTEAPAPGAGLPPEMPAIEPAIEPAALKSKATTAAYREHLKARATLHRMAASINDASLVVAANDDRRLTFKHLKAHLVAIKEPRAKDALAFIGYVPANFDSVWAALVRDGVKVSASNAVFDVKQMMARGLTADEIKFTVCSSNGGVLTKVVAELQAATPMTSKPSDPAPAGMTYVWKADADPSKTGWMLVKAEGKDTAGEVVKVSHTDNKAPASGAPTYPIEKNKEEVPKGAGDDSAGAVVKVPSNDNKAPASGAPKYPTLDPDKAGGNKVTSEDKSKATSVGEPVKVKSEDHQPKPPKINPATIKSGAEIDTIGDPLKVKTYDKQAPASGAPKYPVADPAKGGDAPRDQSVDTLGEPLQVKTEDHQAPASGAPAYPVLDPDKAGGQAAPGTPGAPGAVAPAAPAIAVDKSAMPDQKPAVTPKAMPPKAEPKPEAAAPAPAPMPKAEPKSQPKPEAKEEPKPKAEEKPKGETKSEDKPKADKKPEGEADKDKSEDEKKSKDEKEKKK